MARDRCASVAVVAGQKERQMRARIRPAVRLALASALLLAAFAAALPARADPACDQEATQAATQCVAKNTSALVSGTMSQNQINDLCAKEGHDAKDRCEKGKRAGPRLREVILSKCDEKYCYLIGRTNEQRVCGRIDRAKIKPEGKTDPRDLELYTYDSCPTPVKDDDRAGRRGSQPAFRTTAPPPPPTRANAETVRTPTVQEDIMSSFPSFNLGPGVLGPPPNPPPRVGAPPRTAQPTGALPRQGGPEAPRGTSERRQSQVTGTECISVCTGTNANADTCQRCRARSDKQDKPDGTQAEREPPKMTNCPRSSGSICGTQQVSAGTKYFWCCAPWTCSGTLGICAPPAK